VPPEICFYFLICVRNIVCVCVFFFTLAIFFLGAPPLLSRHICLNLHLFKEGNIEARQA